PTPANRSQSSVFSVPQIRRSTNSVFNDTYTANVPLRDPDYLETVNEGVLILLKDFVAVYIAYKSAYSLGGSSYSYYIPAVPRGSSRDISKSSPTAITFRDIGGIVSVSYRIGVTSLIRRRGIRSVDLGEDIYIAAYNPTIGGPVSQYNEGNSASSCPFFVVYYAAIYDSKNCTYCNSLYKPYETVPKGIEGYRFELRAYLSETSEFSLPCKLIDSVTVYIRYLIASFNNFVKAYRRAYSLPGN
ncbi:uncharacterized protein N7479_004868, partial [Penicillium vulpinum]|uniref:uncharacterized protein n=1 Tax=Penicillium vulpinum TaxID=29845 RepID=UPI002548C448